MDVVIAGGHGQIARHLTTLLSARGDEVRGIIRDEGQAPDLTEDGARPVVLDLESASAGEMAEAIRGSDAVVFAAGAGPGSGAQRKETVDYGAAVKFIEAARAVGARRYVMVSAIGIDHPPEGDDVFSVYQRAKARADEALMGSGLDWTVVRPGRLTDDPATGRVAVARHVARGEIPRSDVADVLRAVLDEPRSMGSIFEVVGGDTPVDEAVASLLR